MSKQPEGALSDIKHLEMLDEQGHDGKYNFSDALEALREDALASMIGAEIIHTMIKAGREAELTSTFMRYRTSIIQDVICAGDDIIDQIQAILDHSDDDTEANDPNELSTTESSDVKDDLNL